MWNSLTPKAQDNAINIATAMVGICLGLSPWLLGFADIWATWSAALLGSAIALIAIKSLLGEDNYWAAFAKMALGLWAAISPAILSFTEATDAALAHLLSGGAGVALSALSFRLQDNRQLSMKRRSPRISTNELCRKAGRP
jgi:hypothetical protein